MMSLAEQIKSAGRIATRESAKNADEARLKALRQAEVRAKQWASRKAGGEGVTEELLKRLPATKEAAVSLSQIKQLLTDMAARESSISSAMTVLVNKKRVLRLGERREYRYYLAESKS